MSAVVVVDGRETSTAELDALVATHVFGWAWDETRCRVCGWPLDPDGEMCVPTNCSMRPPPERRADSHAHYSTERDRAMDVVEHLKDQLPKLVWCAGWIRGDVGHMAWVVEFRAVADCWAAAESLPLAVCLAALAAVGVKLSSVPPTRGAA